MSNQSIPSAPQYWGADYTQQWTPQPPPSLGPMPQNLHFNPDASSDTQQYYNLHTFYANANLPGLGGAGATNTFPPPPFAFPGTFPPAAAPPPFANMPNLGYPLMPLPSNSAQFPQSQPLMHEIDRSTQSKPPDLQPMSTTNSNQDLDREEGELTDIEGPAMGGKSHSSPSARDLRHNQSSSHRSHIPGGAGINRSQMRQSQFTGPKGVHDKTARDAIASTSRRESLSELEEGEASPEPRASSRASGSPYNPHLPTNVISPSISKSSPNAMKTTSKGLGSVEQLAPASTESQRSSSTAVSLAQLRVQAQGALLSLAPHSIRYSELVSEGINPTILKQLYEEVGIKVPTTPLSDVYTRPAANEDVYSSASPSVANGDAKQPTQQVEPQVPARQMLTPSEPSSTPPKSAPVSARKPMERKEVIARMLAAKAAKSSPASAPPPFATQTADVSQSTPATAEKSTTSTPAQDPMANEKENRLKEKNKAQTELARQRIEQLKKQGLMRNPQKSQSDSDKEQANVQESPQPQNTIVQHPLPERPPLPVSTSLDHIPGLFMTEQTLPATNGVNATPVQEPILESATHSRSSQRKRPRASDFDDDPIPIPKRTFSNGTNHQIAPERLVIDISDDEFYDDDDVSMDIDTTSTGLSKNSGIQAAEGLHRAYLSAAESLPHRPATSQSYGISSSSTPNNNNNRNGEQDDLRKKDLEIQAMHRRIAELEQRKKAKLASRTQSPRTSDLSTPEIASMPAPSMLPALPIVPNKNVEKVLASMDIDGMRKMKSKILRMQEIEAGIPSLDAVIQKTELKLADASKVLEELASELAKGKDGRQHLLDELNALKSEVPVMSLDDVNAALINMEAKEEFPVEVVQGMLRRLSIPELQQSITTTYSHAIAPAPANEVADERITTVPDVPETDAPTQGDTTPVPHADSAVAKTPPTEGRSDVPNTTEDTAIPAAPVEELTDTSMSDDSSSSMDESSDESDSDSGSLNEEMPDAPNYDANQVASVDEVTNISSGLPNEPEKSEINDEPLSENQPPTTQPTTDEDLGADSENLASRESPVSDAYEPPEPEESANASDSSYSPAPSPDFHSPAPHMEVSGSSEDQSQEAGELLTKKIQDLDFQQPSQYSQSPLDNTRRPEDSHRKLTPYTSPLKLFKAYRYHPNYNDNVAGGYRSLTYSHNIDPLKHFCPYETSGGVCNDRSCEFQHFRDMALSGASMSEPPFAQLLVGQKARTF
ncbi:uncharacterized protein DSM5745_07656 [Aspergillus mulundensis]|uniref:Putative zinc-finger domain-containing protein n=1 Tax=Aspergillus mulundensis TaxID=1810919 RepID=A0A3D8RF21_9EURO|nr:Uncharacterized protein DSM5745_07656 [Aspergillus mulundensis]RDW72484.1 Uncharacterized protein DSM5745_07656 [Aspergillus mulundensis]